MRFYKAAKFRILAFFYWKKFNKRNHCLIQNTHIPKTVKIGKYVRIGKETNLGSNVVVGDYSEISEPNNYIEAAVIGKYCSIGSRNVIGISNHNYSWVTTSHIIVSTRFNIIDENVIQPQKAPPIIGNDVWIGVNCAISRGIKIGDGAVIAAGSVVTKDVPPYAIVGGVPAKVIKFRFSKNDIEKLLEIKWWDWSAEKVKEEVVFMYDIKKFIERNQLYTI